MAALQAAANQTWGGVEVDHLRPPSTLRAFMSEFLRQLLGPDTKAPRWFVAVVVLILAAAGWWYVTSAIQHGNTVSARIDHQLRSERHAIFDGDEEAQKEAGRPMYSFDLNDQRVYMNYAKGMRESGFDSFTTRMRMPMYMWVLAFATDSTPRELTPEALTQFYVDFFPVARAFNIGLSLVALVVLFFTLRGWLGNWLGLAFCLMAAFQLYILKSPYVQPEILLTTFITLGMVWAVKTLHQPTWQNALVTGLLLCGWHLTKANALVALGFMGMVMGLQLLTARTWPKRKAIVIAGLVTLAAYVTPMSPYLYTSWKIFHDPFYNVQSKYYMWAEDVHEKHEIQKMGLDRDLSLVDKDGDGKIDRPEEMPTAGNYVKNHTREQIKKRLYKGMSMMVANNFEEYTAIHWLHLLWAGILLWAMSRRWNEAVFGAWSWRWSILFVGLFLVTLFYLFAWFTPLKVGPRLLNSISLVPLFFCMSATAYLLKNDVMRMGRLTLSSTKVVTVVFLAFWLVLTALQVPHDLRNGYFAG